MQLLVKYCKYCPLWQRIRHLKKSNDILCEKTRNYSQLNTYLSNFDSKHPQKDCEKFWSDLWQKNRLFSEDKSKKSSDKPYFSLLLPPPNITGSLHLGHALTLSIEDSICRYHRMKGHSVRWIPGLDHAGIATQMVVEKRLWTKHQKTRHDLSRDQFLAEVNDWINERSVEIREQFLKLGVALDFDKQFYTLSDDMSEAVTEAFVRLFNSGHIYRHSMAVNWSYFLRSTISDIEVEYQSISGPTLLTVPGFEGKVLVGVIHRFNYPIEGTTGDVIPVATTRLEANLGDVAVAVHPDDNRYSHLIGRNAINPFNGRLMPIISDQSVRQDFGTGAVKITPGHSQVDYEVAQRHGLPIVNTFDDCGRLVCPELPQFHGLHRFEAKEVFRTELQNKGLYLDQSDHNHRIPLCSRSGDIIESRRVPQWFLKCDKQKILAQFVVNRDIMSETEEQNWNALKEELAEDDRHMSIIPPNYRNVWREWFNRFEDWCISRQIYWGHRIPAFNVIKDNQLTDEWIAAKSESIALSIAKARHPLHEITVRQDNDVLDTWFSSALLPLSVNGWPKEELNPNQFPLSLLETGHDILFFWVARMTLMSLLLVNKLPFPRVLLHGMVCDADGKKMSKSKGNAIDPNDIINGISLQDLKHKNINHFKSGILSKKQLDLSLKQLEKKFPKGIIDCGADSLRFYLLQSDFKEENVFFDVQDLISSRNFCNKMHQTIRFFISNIDHRFKSMDISSLEQHLSPIDRWILSSLVEVIKKCNQCFDSYDLQYGAQSLRHFWQNLLCDIYLEDIKPIIYSEDIQKRNSVLNVMSICVLTSLRAIHPFMPFITENLWQHINHRMNPNSDRQEFKSICDENYPELNTEEIGIRFDFGIKEEMRLIDAIVQKIRWFRHNFQINKTVFNSSLVLIAINGNYLQSYRNLIQNSTKVNELKIVSIHDIHKYDKCFCFKIQLKDNKSYNISEQTDEEVIEQRNSFRDCYVLFDIDLDSVFNSMSSSGVKTEVMSQKREQLEQYKCCHFHQNFWKTKSLRQNLK